ncbi:MAG: hypothetical protein M3T55_06575 [Pseudomonadota bacterium]|nr:hypothetical protein [Pseudomonadota bacterium]
MIRPRMSALDGHAALFASSITRSQVVAARLGRVVLAHSPFKQILVTATAALTNVDNKFSGEGSLGDGLMTLINKATGVINANDVGALSIDTGANTIVNAGLTSRSGPAGRKADGARARISHRLLAKAGIWSIITGFGP